MGETLITFETAKLAKEKGFTTHSVTTKFTNDYLLGGKNILINKTCILLWMCELQKWLREVHDIDITILPYGQMIYRCNLYKNKVFIKAFGLNDNYEELLELALKESLKLIPEIT